MSGKANKLQQDQLFFFVWVRASVCEACASVSLYVSFAPVYAMCVCVRYMRLCVGCECMCVRVHVFAGACECECMCMRYMRLCVGCECRCGGRTTAFCEWLSRKIYDRSALCFLCLPVCIIIYMCVRVICRCLFFSFFRCRCVCV